MFILGISVSFVDELICLGTYDVSSKEIKVRKGEGQGLVLLHELTHAIDYWYQSQHNISLSRKYADRLTLIPIKDWVDNIQGEVFVYDEYLAYWAGQDEGLLQAYLACNSMQAAADYLDWYLDNNLPKPTILASPPRRMPPKVFINK